MSRNTKIAEVLKSLEGASVDDLLTLHGKAADIADVIGQVLMNTLESYSHPAALAMVLAAVHASLEGENCPADVDGFVTEQDRLDIFLGIYRVFFKDAMRLKGEIQTMMKDDGDVKSKGQVH